ncbi:MAG: hypothetical protein A2X49_02425 [Lentisphaerae bacterium GWF2_52_8]|nr:MAG: hypothetical protein A2X49_02425 [Lentisphaerae bacterium GWF2_52_8]
MQGIIHLSDLHIGYPGCTEAARKIVGQIIRKITPPGKHVIVITGDLVENAFSTEQQREAARQVKRFKKAGFKVLCAPGNHDCGTGVFGSKELAAAFRKRFLGSAQAKFPKLNVIEGAAFIGLDSMADELNWHDRVFAEGELGERQLMKLELMLKSARVQKCQWKLVYLHHHPFSPLFLNELKAAESLEKIIAGRVDALLFGHNHLGGVHNGRWGIPRCYDGGSSTGKEGAPREIRLIMLPLPPETDVLLPFC